MNTLHFSGIEITAIAACVPKNKESNRVRGELLIPDKQLLEETIKSIGIENRRVADASICTSDLCEAAAEKIFAETKIDKSDIDAIIFVSQSLDYLIPSTACLLQNRLGLSKKTIAFDVNLGCSGYVYGLFIAYSFANIHNLNNVLLLAGDTSTKLVSDEDKSSGLLFGDGGSATLVKKTGKIAPTYFNLFTDGNYDFLHVKDGAYRNPVSRDSLEIHTDIDGNTRNNLQLFMDGAEVFNFTIREIPESINSLLKYCNLEIENIDQFIFHQPNQFILNFLCRKIKIPKEKFLSSLNDFGNTSSASIPITFVSNKENYDYRKVLMSGFGVGLSWANCQTDLSDTTIIDLIEI